MPMITICLKPTYANSLHILAGIAPSYSCTSRERWQVVRNGHGKQRTKGTHSMDISEWCRVRLKLRKSFIKCTEPINTTAKAAHMALWRERATGRQFSSDEHLPAGAKNLWTTWKALNRLRTQVGRSRVNMDRGGDAK